MSGLVMPALPRSDTAEILEAAAVDSLFYSTYFFPKTCKQTPALFHPEVWDVLERPENRYVGIEVYREGAKTSLTRMFASKRIAYGLSRFVVFVSKAEKHAIYSVDWMRRQVLYNARFRDTFQLSLTKRSEKEIEIVHGVEGHTIRVLALGMTGQLRGFNVDDDRPDLIVGDDLDDDETAGSETQREKQQSLFFGALIRSLVAHTENPYAKAVVLQTPIHRDDIIESIRRDPQWITRCFGCFTESGQSRWPARHPTETLLEEKEAYIARNQLSIWMREMECQIIPQETRTFRVEWLRQWEILPEGCVFYMAIDPAASDREDASYQAVAVIGCHGRDVYLAEYAYARGQTLAELAAEVFRMYLKYRPLQVGVETIAYQRVCAWYLKEESYKRQVFLPIVEVQDRRPKDARITDAITSVAADGRLYVRADQHEFLTEYADFPDPRRKDVIDAVAIALNIRNPALAGEAIDVRDPLATTPLNLEHALGAP